ncbi:MAG: HEAT repeat domain-containing protein [Chloroherpetonaceae bacterium]|nr:HEAT repeat domain-containing protein [Chthonomonadaceae bacterium]MDW8207847.1 HEAT repeat domain-containing protein [Chloroherpetonaceae bacterium]
MRKYLNYIVFGLIVLLVVGLAVNHSNRMRRLIHDMASGTPQQRAAAAAELIKAEQFMDSITGEEAETRAKIAGALVALGTPEAVTQAINMAKDQEKEVRDAAVVALQAIGGKSPDHIKALAAGLGNGDVNARKAVIRAFTDPEKGIGPKPGVVEAIVEQMKASGGARGPGGDVLGHPTFTRQGANRVSVPLLIAQLQDPDEGVRSGAAEALGKIGDPAAIPPLKERMHQDTAQVRRITIGAIALIAHPSGEDALEEAIRNPNDDNEARAQAAAGLGKIATRRAIATLLRALSDDDLKLRSAAVAALARAGRPTPDAPVNRMVVALLDAALRAPEESVRLGAAQALQLVATPETNASLIVLLRDRSQPEAVRAAAARALGFPGNAPAVAPLIRALDDASDQVIAAARDALSEIGTPATDALLAALKRGGPVALYASQALARRGAQVLPALQRAAADTSPISQRWAAVTLGDLGVAEARPILEALQKSPDPDVAYVAREQLERIGRKR